MIRSVMIRSACSSLPTFLIASRLIVYDMFFLHVAHAHLNYLYLTHVARRHPATHLPTGSTPLASRLLPIGVL